MPRVRDRCPGSRLSLAGAHAPHEVRALAAPDVSVLGFVPDVETLVRRAAVLAAPVRTGGGMRMKLLHSMALGKAVVTTPRGIDGLLANQADLPVLVADDADGLAEAVARLLVSREERASLGVRARSYVAEHHTAQAYARRLEATYADLRAHAVRDEAGQVVG
jgi:glycosyltransferase involved in cell wall biosynthesis